MMDLDRGTRPWVALAAVAAAVVAGMLSIVRPAPLLHAAGLLSDSYFGLNHRAPDARVVLVAVDHKSVRALGRWPWPRERLAEGFAKLGEAGAVGLDMTFVERTDAAADAALGRALGKINAVGGFFLNDTLAREVKPEEEADLVASAVTDMESAQLPFGEVNVVDMPIAQVRQSVVFNASLNTHADGDGLFRHYPLGFIVRKQLYPTLGLQALRLYTNQEIRIRELPGSGVLLGETAIPMGADGFTRLNYYPRAAYHAISFVDLLEGRVPPETFKGKIVIVGVTETGAGDVVSTPLGTVPGPLLHYTFVSNMLDGSMLKTAPRIENGMVIGLALLPGVLAIFAGGLGRRAVIYALAAGLAVAVCLGAYHYGDYWIELLYPLAGLILGVAMVEGTVFVSEERKGRFLRAAFGSYVAPAVLDSLIEKPESLALGGTVKTATFLFSDIRNFTSLSERTDTRELVQTLNDLFTPLTAAVLEHEGMLDKYIGDAIMAVFNAPLEVENHAEKACLAALDMLQRLDEFNAGQRARGAPEIDIGIGINTGEALIGNLGSKFRFNYTALGDAVNLASRFEGLNKEYHTHIIIGESTWRALNGRLPARFLGQVPVKGKAEPQPIYELLAPAIDKG